MKLQLAAIFAFLSAVIVLSRTADDLGVGHDPSRKKIEYPSVDPTPEPCPAGCKGGRGDKGTAGRPGRRGNSGDRGHRGPPAVWPPWPKNATVKGDKGEPGANGLKGREGDVGAGGEKGNKGIDGTNGPAGAKGAKGESGAGGIRGEDGDAGIRGDPGNGGSVGRRGDTGDRGAKGNRGVAGAPGAQGQKGAIGDDGEDGNPGDPGARGEKGAKGLKGGKGDSGNSGSSGQLGEKGDGGENGEQGRRGARGKNGDGGRKGRKGETGPPVDTVTVTRDACTQDLEGEVRYEPDLQSLYYCDGNQWRCVRHKPCTGVRCGNLTEGDMEYTTTSRTDFAQDYACIVTLIDESGTMSGEQEWLPLALLALEQLLVASNIGVKRPNQYAYVGFGVPAISARIVQYQNRDWFSASDLQAAAQQLNTDGDTEDGWYAIKFAIDNITLPEDCARNFLLVTDEARAESPQGRGLTKEFVLQLLRANNITLNVIANIAFSLDRGDDAFGVEYQGFSFGVGRDNYLAYDEPLSVTPGRAFCQSYKDYGELGLKTRGAVWDLETLRQGAVQAAYATAFTNALTEVKQREIVSTSVDCNECECADDGLGEGTMRCMKSTNLPYCVCRATPGETERSCRRVQTGDQSDATRAPFDPSTIVAADCATAGK